MSLLSSTEHLMEEQMIVTDIAINMANQEKKIDEISSGNSNPNPESFSEGKAGGEAEDIVYAAEQEFDSEQYRRLLWKIDLVILPLMWVGKLTLYLCSRGISFVSD